MILLCLSAARPASASLSLPQVYQAALERNEDAATAQENVVQAEENYSRAKAALFPAVNLIASITRQDTPTAGIGSSISPAEQKALRVNLTQPLFRGFREYAGLRQQAVLSEGAKLSREQAQLQLFLDVSDVYFQTALAARDVTELKKELEANQQRRAELLRFRKLGRSRATDVLSLEANLASLEAQLEQSKNTLQASQTAFFLLTGIQAESAELTMPAVPSRIAALEKYLQRLPERPDLRSLEKNVVAADEGITIARGGHWPSLDLNANYYFERPGVLQNVKWDVQLALTFPIFQGGAIASTTTQAISQHKQSELALERAKRLARQQVMTQHQAVQSDRVQVQKQKASVEAWAKSYQANQKDYRLGIVNNLEVLQSLTNAQVSRRNLARAEIQLLLDYIRLEVAVGSRGVIP